MIDKENGRREGSSSFPNSRYLRYPTPRFWNLFVYVGTIIWKQTGVLLDEIFLCLDHLGDATINRYTQVLLLSRPSNVSVDEIDLCVPLSQNIWVHGAIVVCCLRADQKSLFEHVFDGEMHSNRFCHCNTFLDNLRSIPRYAQTSLIRLFMDSLLRSSPFFTP